MFVTDTANVEVDNHCFHICLTPVTKWGAEACFSLVFYLLKLICIFFLQILRVLSENAVAVRTKAMKCLTAVVEADPGILARVRNKS